MGPRGNFGPWNEARRIDAAVRTEEIAGELAEKLAVVGANSSGVLLVEPG